MTCFYRDALVSSRFPETVGKSSSMYCFKCLFPVFLSIFCKTFVHLCPLVSETWTEQVEEQPTLMSVVRTQEAAAQLLVLVQCTSVSELDKTCRS